MALPKRKRLNKCYFGGLLNVGRGIKESKLINAYQWAINFGGKRTLIDQGDIMEMTVCG